MAVPDIQLRRESAFVLWRPKLTNPAPELVLGRLIAGNPAGFVEDARPAFVPSADHADLWQVPLASLGLADDLYHYWFEVNDALAGGARIRVADPFTATVDYRVLSNPGQRPASVVKVAGGKLVAADASGDAIVPVPDALLANLAPNNRLVILGEEEFADQHDRPVVHPFKQRDPVNFSRLAHPWRKQVFDVVARLVRLRTSAPALAVNDTAFIHYDFTPGRRVMAWVRGRPGLDEPVVVVANFSDFSADDGRYRVNGFPDTPSGRHWFEVTTDTDLAGRRPDERSIAPWTAKVFRLA